MSDHDRALPSDLAVAVIRFARHLRLRRRETSTLPLSQLSVLTVLHREGPTTPGTLASWERITPASMTRTLADLEKAGLTTRSPHPTDGRTTIITITPLGSDTVITDADARDHWLRAQLAHLATDERAVLRATADTIETLLDDAAD